MKPAFVHGSDTSKAAADSIEPHAPTLRDRILDAIRVAADGLTCDEVEVLLDLRHQTASARLRELVRLGAVVDSGRRRPTRTGRNATVLVHVSACPVAPAVCQTEPVTWFDLEGE